MDSIEMWWIIDEVTITSTPQALLLLSFFSVPLILGRFVSIKLFLFFDRHVSQNVIVGISCQSLVSFRKSASFDFDVPAKVYEPLNFGCESSAFEFGEVYSNF